MEKYMEYLGQLTMANKDYLRWVQFAQRAIGFEQLYAGYCWWLNWHTI